MSGFASGVSAFAMPNINGAVEDDALSASKQQCPPGTGSLVVLLAQERLQFLGQVVA